MIRSGSTLQYNLVRCLVESMGLGEGEGFFVTNELSNSKLIRWANDERYHIIKMHEIHPKVAEMAAAGSVRILYIVRDIRDVAVSAKQKFAYEDEASLFETLDLTIAAYYKIKGLPGVLWQKYEDVVKHIPAATNAQAAFLALEPTEEIVSAVARECSLDNVIQFTGAIEKTLGFKMKSLLYRRSRLSNRLIALLEKLGSAIYLHDRRTVLHPNHISENRGRSGLWKTNLTEDELGEIQKRYWAWLKESGYRL